MNGAATAGIHQVAQKKHEITRKSTMKQNQQLGAKETKLRPICFLEKWWY